MADKKIITDELLKLQTEKVLQVIADNVYQEEEYLEQEIDDMFDATPQEISYYESLINPDVVSENRLWSSKTIDEKLASAILEANKYTDQASTRNLTTEIVSSTADVTKENVLYLILSNASTNTYEQYMLIGGTATALGSTQVDLSNIYNKSEVDTKLGDKANKSEVLSMDSVQAIAGSETNNTVYTSKLTKDELDKKVNVTDVVDNLTSTDTDKPLSANQGKVLKDEVDKKANNNDVVKKIDIVTTIDKTSTDEQVYSAKGIYNSLINKVDNPITISTADEVNSFNRVFQSFRIDSSTANAVGLPNPRNAMWFCIHLSHIKGYKYPSQIAFEYAGDKKIMYRTAANGVWGAWRKIPTTSVADVPRTALTFPNTTYYEPAVADSCYYFVKNGICYINLRIKAIAPTILSTDCVITGLPKTATTINQTISPINTGTKGMQLYQGGTTLNLRHGEVGGQYEIFYSYPVAE